MTNITGQLEGEKSADPIGDTSGFYYGSLFLRIMGLCLNSNPKLPNMWKYTSLLSLVKLDLKLKKVRLSVSSHS